MTRDGLELISLGGGQRVRPGRNGGLTWMPGGLGHVSTLWHFAFCKEMGKALRSGLKGWDGGLWPAEVSLGPREGKEASGFLEVMTKE